MTRTLIAYVGGGEFLNVTVVTREMTRDQRPFLDPPPQYRRRVGVCFCGHAVSSLGCDECGYLWRPASLDMPVRRLRVVRERLSPDEQFVAALEFELRRRPEAVLA